MALGVYCECGRCLPIVEEDAGTAVSCSCGRRVVVPLLEEFRDQPLLVSATTLERRVGRLIAEGVLPRTDACLQCGEVEPQVVTFDLECERYTSRAYGGQRFLILPLLWGFVWATWREPERVEIHGRDTDITTLVALCATCQRQLRAPAGSWYLILTALLLVVSGFVGYVDIVAGIGIAVLGLMLLILTRHLALRRGQNVLKSLLLKVPLYRQILERYPWAVVAVRPKERGVRNFLDRK